MIDLFVVYLIKSIRYGFLKVKLVYFILIYVYLYFMKLFDMFCFLFDFIYINYMSLKNKFIE